MSRRLLRVAVPGLPKYGPQSGIGRVLHSLAAHWGDVELVPATYVSPKWPLLRNVPTRLEVPEGTDLVLLPQLKGATALRGRRSVPAVAIVHDIGIVDCEEDLEATNTLTRWVIRQSLDALRYAERIVAVSQFTDQRLLAHMPQLKGCTTVVYNGVGSVFLHAGADKEKAAARLHIERLAGVQMKRPVVTYVGRETPRKNVGALVGTLAELRRTEPSAQLWKVGAAGHERWRSRTMARIRDAGLTVGEDVVFLQGISDEDLASMYRASDVFVTASNYEGFGLPVLEAMAVGTSVVTSNRGALPEVVGQGGRVVEPTATDLAESVREAIVDGTRSTATARAASFSWAKSADRYREVFDELIAEYRQDRKRA